MIDVVAALRCSMLTCAWAVFSRRFGLILEIFASNATTKEAQLQVQLATARYE